MKKQRAAEKRPPPVGQWGTRIWFPSEDGETGTFEPYRGARRVRHPRVPLHLPSVTTEHALPDDGSPSEDQGEKEEERQGNEPPPPGEPGEDVLAHPHQMRMRRLRNRDVEMRRKPLGEGALTDEEAEEYDFDSLPPLPQLRND